MSGLSPIDYTSVMENSAIKYRDVRKSYSRKEVLKGIDLSVENGEFFGLVGANGAGKTTMIKSLLDFIAVDTGEIEIFGQTHTRPHSRSSLSFLPERFVPPYFLTGSGFLQYIAKMHSQPYQEADAKALCEALDLDESALSQRVRKYSKGMAQKLGLAGCFISKRPLLILDEPMSGLDPKARIYLKKHLQSLKEQGQTLFFSTHMLADVEAICDRMAILHEGVIQFVGTPVQCCEQYGAASLEEAYLNCIMKSEAA